MPSRIQDFDDEPFLELEHDGVPILLIRIGEYGVRSFVREYKGQLLRCMLQSESPLRLADHLGNVWNADGELIAEPDVPKDGHGAARMRLARGYLTEWYEWVSNKPNTSVFNRIEKRSIDLRNVTVLDEQGAPFSLAELSAQYNVFVFGCGTSTLLESNIAALEALYQDYRGLNVDFYLVNRTLAHPGRQGFVDCLTDKERVIQSSEVKAKLGSTIPWIADNVSNDFITAVAAGADTELIVDSAGVVLQSRDWCNPVQLRNDLANLVGKVAAADAKG